MAISSPALYRVGNLGVAKMTVDKQWPNLQKLLPPDHTFRVCMCSDVEELYTEAAEKGAPAPIK